jgi:hypothetical protein
MEFSDIVFTENPIDRPVGRKKRENVGCIQLAITKVCDVKYSCMEVDFAAADTSTLNIWEQDDTIAGQVTVATRFFDSVVNAQIRCCNPNRRGRVGSSAMEYCIGNIIACSEMETINIAIISFPFQ